MDTRNEWRNPLLSEHAEVARRIARKMARRCPDQVAREDRVAAGMLGLTEAAERHDESRTEPFLSFAEHRIRGAVLDELRRGDMLPRRSARSRTISNTIRELENADEATREACLAAGADEVFCKPFPAIDLRRRLTEVALALRASAAGERSASPIEFPGWLCEPVRWEWTTPPHGQG